MSPRRGGAAVLSAACFMLILAAAAPPALSESPPVENAPCEAARNVSNPDTCDPHYAQPSCKTLDSAWGFFLQFLLLVIGFVSLLVKKHVEERRTGEYRTYSVWGLDVSKQAIASICAHMAGLLNSQILNHMNSVAEKHDSTQIVSTDECSWYFTSFTLDTTLGVFLSYCMFRLQVKLSSKVSCIGALGQSGDYVDLDNGSQVNYRRWAAQLAVWCAITVIARFMVLGVQAMLFPVLRHFVAMFAQTMACRPDAMLTLVMIACPVLMNIMGLWIQDQFLKKQPPQQPAPAELVESTQVKPIKKRNIRKVICNYVLLGIVVFLVLGTVLFYVVYVGAEQGNYDQCYTQVRTKVVGVNPDNPDLARSVSDLVYSNQPRHHDYNLTHETCGRDDSIHSLSDFLEHRWDLIDADGNPQCQCCNRRTQPGGKEKCEIEDQVSKCTGVGECCGRSLLHSMDRELVESCSVCPIYLPCDERFCPARPDFIRNPQHIPLLLGAFLSLLGNGYVLYTYTFDEKLQKANITRLLSSASFVEVFKSASIVLQEMLFRIPRQPCFPEEDIDGNGYLDKNDCPSPPQWHDWPTWEQVQQTYLRVHNSESVGEAIVDGQRGSTVAMCWEMSFMYQFTWTAYDSYFWMITVDLVLNLYTSPFGSTTRRWRFYHGWTWALSLALSVWLIAVGDWGVSYNSILEDFCWNVNWGQPGKISGDKDSLSNSPILMRTVYILSALYYFTSLAGAAVAYWKVGKLTQGLRQAREDTIKEGRQVVLWFSAWQVCFISLYLWILRQTPEIVNGTRWEEGARRYQQDHEVIVGVWAFVLGARNFINFLVWKFVVIPRHNKAYESELARMTQAMLSTLPLKGSPKSADSSEDIDGTPVQELNEVLMRELLFFTGLGIRSAVRFPYGEHASDEVRAPNTQRLVDGPDPFVSEWDVSLKEASEHEDNHNTPFAANMRQVFSVGPTPEARESLVVSDSEQQQRDQEEKERREHLTQFKFKTYEPQKFRRLRELLEIDVCGDDGQQSLLLEAMESYQIGSFTGGASGSFMYYSGDRRFIVKQITDAEKDVMLEILDDYIEHIEGSQRGRAGAMGPVQSLLLRVVQLNRIQMYQHEICGQTVMKGQLYFVVTENCFYRPLLQEVELMKHLPEHQGKTDADLMRHAEKNDFNQYDLKGSWVGRSTAVDSKGRWQNMAGKTQKDNDLQEKLYLSWDDKEQLCRQIESDSLFLSTHNIMDYSLLLGIRKGVSNVESHAEGDGDVTTVYHAAAAHHSQRYYVGIIDILQQWDGSKKRETCFKVCCLGKDPEGLSSMEPMQYQERFSTAMASKIATDSPERSSLGNLMTPSMSNLDLSAEPEGTNRRWRASGGGGGGRGRELAMIGSE